MHLPTQISLATPLLTSPAAVYHPVVRCDRQPGSVGRVGKLYFYQVNMKPQTWLRKGNGLPAAWERRV